MPDEWYWEAVRQKHEAAARRYVITWWAVRIVAGTTALLALTMLTGFTILMLLGIWEALT